MKTNRDDINKMSNEELVATIMAKVSTMPRFSSISGFTDAAKELAEWLSEESCNKSEPKEINIHLGYPKMIFTENCDCITFTFNSINNYFGREKYCRYMLLDDNQKRLSEEWHPIININEIPLNSKYIQFMDDIGNASSIYPIEFLKNIEEVTNLPNEIKTIELTEQEYKDILTRLDKLEKIVKELDFDDVEKLEDITINKKPKEINIHLGYPKMIFTENCDCITFTFNSINNYFGKEKYHYYTIFDDNRERLFKQWKNIVNINKIPLNAKYIQFINDIGDKSSMYPIEILKNIEEVTNLPNKIKKVELTEQKYKDILARLDKLERKIQNEEKTADQMFEELGYGCEFKTDIKSGEIDYYLYSFKNDPIHDKYIKIYLDGYFYCNSIITLSEHKAIIKKISEMKNENGGDVKCNVSS